jgi:hypothetical protein
MPTTAPRSAVASVLVAAALGGFAGGAVLANSVGGADQAPAAGPTSPPSSPSPSTPAAGITLAAEPAAVAAGTEVRLTGSLEPPAGGVNLQVQRSLDGGEGSDFPVTTRTADDGTFSVSVNSSRPGENRFRVVGTVAGEELVSSEAVVAIG